MLRFAIVGVGYWGPNYARLLSGVVRGASLVAAVDRSPERLALISQAHPAAACYDDHRRMLEAGGVDAVIVATPASAHRAIVEDCLDAGLPVLVEKPLAHTSEDSKAMVDAAERTGVMLMVGHTFVFNPAVQRIKRLIDDGDLGRILYFSFNRTGLGPIRQDVNALWDLAPHDLSMAQYWLGGAEPLEVVARGQSYLRAGTDDVVFLTIRYPGDVLAGVHVSWLDPVKDRRVTIVGDRRMVVFDDVSLTEKLRVYDKGASYQPRSGDFSDFVAAVRDGDIVIPKVESREPLREQLTHFITCIVEGRRPVTTAADGHQIVRVLEAAQAGLLASRLEPAGT